MNHNISWVKKIRNKQRNITISILFFRGKSLQMPSTFDKYNKQKNSVVTKLLKAGMAT